MAEHSAPMDPQELLAQTVWMRRLARSLLLDDNRVDDVLQDTLMRALEHPPRDSRALRAWLSRVLKNSVWRSHRDDTRRGARERKAARPEAIPPSDPRLARLELHRRLVDTVIALAEPYRTCVILRFFDDRTPPEIAKELGVPLATVHTRLRRALERLREQLDADFDGDRKAWCLAILPLAGAVPGAGEASAASLSSTVTGTRALALIALVAVTTTLVMAMLPGDGNGAHDLTVATPDVADDAPPAEPAAPAPHTAPAPEATAARVVSGIVRSAYTNKPIASATVALEVAHANGTVSVITRAPTDTDGRYELRLPRAHYPGRIRIEARHSRFREHSVRLRDRIPTALPDLALVPAAPVTGRVFLPGGQPASGGVVLAKLNVHAVFSFREPYLRYDGKFSRSYPIDADGRFSIPVTGQQAAVQALVDGYQPAFSETIEVVPGKTANVEIHLEEGATLRGVVLAADGTPVVGARVQSWSAYPDEDSPDRYHFLYEFERATFTDAQGRFSLIGTPHQISRFWVHHDDHESYHSGARVTPADGPPIEIMLEPRSTSRLRGQLVDSAGQPLSAGPGLLRRSRDKGRGRPVHIDGNGAFHATVDKKSERAWLFVEGFEPLEIQWQATSDEPDLGTLRLTAGSRVRVRVLDTAGQPISGATVLVKGEVQNYTDADGIVLCGAGLGDSIGITASCTGYTKRAIAVDRTEGLTEAEVTLKRAAQVTGRVVTSEGDPVSGAVVRLAIPKATESGIPYPATDANGNFQLKGIPCGVPLVLHVRHPQRPVYRLEVDLLEPGESRDFGELALEDGRQVTGRVVDTSGRGLAEAAVLVKRPRRRGASTGDDRRDPPFDLNPTALTDADGNFVVTGLPAGKLQIGCRVFGTVNPALQTIDTSAGDVGDVRFILEQGYTYTGLMVHPNGSPVVEANVTIELLENHESTGGGWAYQTDYLGRIRIPGVGTGPVRLCIWGPAGSHRLEAPSATALPKRIVVPDVDSKYGSILAHVSVARGRSQPNELSYRLFRASGHRSSTDQHWAGEPLELDRVDPGAHTLVVSAPGYLRAVHRDVEVSVGRTTELSIVLEPGPPPVVIEVRDRDGVAVPGARVQVAAWSDLEKLVTDSEGRCSSIGIRDVAARLTVVARGYGLYTDDAADTRITGESIAVRLAPESILTGRVTDASGQLVDAPKFTLSGPGLRPSIQSTENPARFSGLSAGRFTLYASTARGVPLGRTEFQLEEAEAKSVTIRAAEPMSITGRVTVNQEALADGVLTVHYQRTQVDGNGQFSVETSVAESHVFRYSFRLSEATRVTLSQSVSIGDPAHPVHVDYPAVSAAGRVVGHDGSPVPGIRGIARQVGAGGQFDFQTDQHGGFELPFVGAGEYSLVIHHPGDGHAAHSEIVEIEAGTELTVHLQRAATLRVNLDGIPLAGGVHHGGPYAWVFRIDSQGALSAAGFVDPSGCIAWPVGTHRGVLRATGCPWIPFTVDMPSGGTEIHLTLEPGGTIAVVLQDGSGRPWGRVPVHIEAVGTTPVPAGLSRLLTDEHGRLGVTLAPGRYRVRALLPGGEELDEQVEVAVGEVVDVPLP